LMDVRIYQPPKSAMQSGRAVTGSWLLEYELPTARRPEPLMGWTSSNDTLNSVKLRFDTKELAIAFAEKNGWGWSVEEPHARRVRPRSYADNFRQPPPAPNPVSK
jgi:hypothetical protein